MRGVLFGGAQQQRRVTGGTATIRSFNPLWWYDAKDLTATTQQTVTDRIDGGDLRSGSTTGVDASDPTVTLGARNFWRFDGSDDFLQHPAAEVPAGSISLLMMVRATTGTGFNVIWSSETQFDNALSLIMTGATFSARCASGGTSSSVTPGAGSTADGSWRVVGVQITSGSPSTFRVYERVAGFGPSVNAGTPNHGTPRWGTRGWTITNQFAGDMTAGLLFPSALPLTDLNTVADILLAGTYT